MTRSTKKTAAVLAGAVTLASAGYAIGSQGGDGSAVARESSGSTATTIVRSEHTDRGLSSLARELGVEVAELRAALEDVRDEQPRPELRDADDLAARLASELGISAATVESALRAQRPERGDREDRHAAIADALAEELGLDAAKVRAAFEEVHPQPGERRERRDPAAVEAALARELGVSVARLREAFHDIRPARGPFGGDVAALARAMGVTTARLEAALEKLRAEHEAEHEQRRAAFARALAARLGLEQSKVEEALEDSGPFGGHGGRRGFGGPGGPGGPGR